jgi:EAL domain-containing protein (putative c-di-GMP-specific phosphodiesterase class I)/GGDEF domain-containing protein
MVQGTDNQHAGQELRRDRRFQVSQAAIITQPGHTEIACEIRDFCLGGLFLKFTNPEAAIASLAKRADAEVEIVFTPVSINTTQTFRVPAQLKRLSPQGVGVAFARQPVDALRALQKLRMAGHRQKLAAMPASSAHPQLREASTALLSETLLQVHDQMMRMLGDKLNTAALHASGIAEHSGLLSAVQEFSNHAPTLQTSFVQRVLDALKQARPVQTQATRESADGGLALVDELDFEDWLATSSEAHKLEEQFREQLADIEPRVGQLFGFACDHSNNPFGPAVISHAYRNCLEQVPVLARARQVAYATLRDVLSDQLAPLYAELLAMLPVSHAEVEAQPPLQTAQPQHADSPADAAANEPAQAGGAQAPAAASQQGQAQGQGTLSRLTGSLLDFFRGQSASPAAASAQAGAVSGQSGAASAQSGPTSGLSGGMPGQSGGAASAPMGTAPATPGGSAMPGHAPRGPATGSTGGQPGMTIVPGVANSPVLQRLAAAGALPATVTQEMQRSVDMFGALFDTMHAEKSVSEGMRPFFHQLETSLIKLAMSDPQFLSSPLHPAHKVLNTLDRISMVAGDDGKITDERLLRLMSRWTDRINAEADKNPGVFEEARTQLERVVKPLLNERAARVFRLQEMCEGRQAAEVAKQRILRELLARLDERPIPNAVIELLNGGWRNVLLMAEMRHGTDSEEARESWQVMENLREWLDPEQTASPATAEIQTLLQRIDQSLTHVCADKFAQDRIVDQLAATLFDEDKSQHQRTPIAARLNDAASEPLTEAQDNLAERLRVGDWLQFKTLDAPLNLIWIGDRPHVYVFANYRGIKKLDLKRQDLLQSLENNEAEWTEDLELPLMDRSYSAMIQKMQRDLLWQSSHDATTGLANRKTFFRAIRRNWLRSKSTDGGFAVGVIQLDISKPDGDAAGVEIRTPILREFAHILPAHLPSNALLARAGESGIAFWIEAADGAAAEKQSETLLRVITAQPQEINGTRYRVQAAIGLMWAGDCLSPEAYYDNANAASTRARESDTPVMQYSSESEDSGVLALARWAHDLTAILANNQLSLMCQPVAAAADDARTPLYYEVLLHPTADDERIATRDLIAVAERLQRITEVDRWVVRSVMQWMRDHANKAALLGGFSINLSGQSVNNPLFLKFLLAELARGDVPGDKLIFEISEADAVEGHAQTQLFIRQLQRHSCHFTLDDFGVGSSSYTSLKSMKLDYLKIDRALVREIGTSMIDEALVRSILETGSFLGIKTVAGFVEDEEGLAKLRDMGIDCVQGYLIGELQPLESLA